MGLSSELLTQFAKVTKVESSKRETIVYGTIAEKNGAKYLIIDGSDSLTPISTTVDMIAGERVTAMIKNHTAVVTGNITSPAARTDDVKTVINGVPTGAMNLKDGELTLGNLNAEELLYNILIGLSAVYIRNGSTTIAKFAKDIVELASTDIDLNIYGRAINYYVGSADANFKPYYEAGDSIDIDGWLGSGFVSETSNDVCFSIPLSRPVIGNPTITITSEDGGLIVRQDEEYKFDSNANVYASPSSYSAMLSSDGGFVSIFATFSSSGTSNSPCGINAKLKIIFS